MVAGAERRLGPSEMWDIVQRRGRPLIPYLGFLLIFAVFGITEHSKGFTSGTNLRSIVEQNASIGVMAMTYVFVLSAGEIDLSIGATVALVALVSAVVLEHHGVLLGVLAGLGAGLSVGLVNGLLTVLLRVPSFLITLGMTSVVGGIGEAMTNLTSIGVPDQHFDNVFGSGTVAGIPSLFIWLIVVLVIAHVALKGSRFGRHILAVGGNRDAALSMGLRVKALRVSALVISSLGATLAGLLYAGRLQGAVYTLGSTDLLTVIAAAIIGGTSLFGGRGSVPGALVGALLLGMLQEGLVLFGLTVPDQMIAEGLVVIVAVSISLRERAE
jgi:ribose transport system permease protein